MSESVDRLRVLAERAGLESSDGQWTEAFVHWFDCPMPDAVRQAGLADPRLTFFKEEKTPHLPAHQGFLDIMEKAAITFQTDVRQ